jgi:hypothetical protein
VVAVTVSLSLIFNPSLQTGMLPQDWRDAVVRPIHKQGDLTLCNNYRPISLTSIAVKVLERLICKHLRLYLTDKQCLSHSQFGFREGRSTVLQLIEYLNVITSEIDKWSIVDVLYVGFQKAFDKVPIKEFIVKLDKQFGIRGQTKAA